LQLKIIEDIKLDFDDVLIRPKRSFISSRKDVSLFRQFAFPHSTRTLECVPIVASNMDTTGSFNMANTLAKNFCITCLNKHYDSQEYVDFYSSASFDVKSFSFFSIGTSDSDFKKLIWVSEQITKKAKLKEWQEDSFNYDQAPNICVDVANGYTEQFVKQLSKIRNYFPKSIIMAGNVVTPEMTEELILHGGVDIVKVGIGSGSVCTTRLKAGIGYPQLSAIMECADAAHGIGGHICSDGGCKNPGDVAKAFGGGADFVMIGGMLAGSSDCDGEWEYEYKCETKPDKLIDQAIKRKKSLKFYGMSSREAMNKHHGGVAQYRSSEGKCVSVPYKGLTQDVLNDILGGMRSACTYVGSFSIKDFSKKTTFIRVNNTHNKIYEK
jgi:GMP reductase